MVWKENPYRARRNNIIALNGSEISDIEIEVYGNWVLNIFLWELLHLRWFAYHWFAFDWFIDWLNVWLIINWLIDWLFDLPFVRFKCLDNDVLRANIPSEVSAYICHLHCKIRLATCNYFTHCLKYKVNIKLQDQNCQREGDCNK